MKKKGKEFVDRIRKWFTNKFPEGLLKKERTENILMIAGGVIIVIALLGLIYTIRQYSKSDRIYQDAQKKFVVILPEEDDIDASSQKNDVNENKETSTEPDNGGKETDDREWYELANVDLEGLQAEYPDVAGWILFENEDISYPVVYSGDNETYIRTMYTGKKAEAGSIFMDGESTPDFSDPHTLIYGHNMKNGSMFAGITKFGDTEYFNAHRYGWLATSDKVYRLDFFSLAHVDCDDSFYDGSQPITEWIPHVERLSTICTGITYDASDRFISLSTCTRATGDDRTVLTGRLVEIGGDTDE